MVHILGVTHQVPKDFAAIPPNALKAFNASDYFVVESILYGNQSRRYLISEFEINSKSVAMVDQLRRLDLIDDATKSALLKATPFEAHGLAGVATYRYLEIHKLNHAFDKLEFVKGVDQQLFDKALAAKKTTFNLETPHAAKQAWLEHCNSNDDFQKILMDFENDLKTDRNAVTRMTGSRVYKNAYYGDYELVNNEIIDWAKTFPLHEMGMRCSVQPRNKIWIASLNNILEKTPSTSQIFVAVGRDHLMTDNNFLKLLESSGYQVERIMLRP